MTTWEDLHRRAKSLEARLEVKVPIHETLKFLIASTNLQQLKVQKYSSTAQKINADFLCDEGNGYYFPY